MILAYYAMPSTKLDTSSSLVEGIFYGDCF